MRRRLFLLTFGFICGLGLLQAQGKSPAADDKAIGKWAGAYSGDSSGKYTVSIVRDASQKLGGTLDAVPDSGDGYTATFSTVAIDGTKVTMAYDLPGGEGEVQMAATLDGAAWKGTWKVVDKATKSASQSGEFTGTKH